MTQRIHTLVDLTIDERDHASKQFLEWFVKEQVEEVASVTALLGQLKRASDGNGVFIMDKEASARAFTPPQPLAGRI